MQQIDFINQLFEVYNERKSKNASYSLRAFSRDLGIPKSSLAAAKKGERKLSNKNLKKAAETLGFSQSNFEKIIQDQSEHRLLACDENLLISDWFHLAILNLAKTKHNFYCTNKISNHFGISTEQAKCAFERLVRLNMIEIKKDRFYRTCQPLTSTTDIDSIPIQNHHKQLLGKAELALESTDILKRDFSSVTMAINPDQIPKAKKKVKKFKRDLAKMLETGDAEEVYALTIQLFSLEKGKKNVH